MNIVHIPILHIRTLLLTQYTGIYLVLSADIGAYGGLVEATAKVSLDLFGVENTLDQEVLTSLNRLDLNLAFDIPLSVSVLWGYVDHDFGDLIEIVRGETLLWPNLRLPQAEFGLEDSNCEIETNT